MSNAMIATIAEMYSGTQVDSLGPLSPPPLKSIGNTTIIVLHSGFSDSVSI